MIGQAIGKYRITRQIGAGGMGAVYEAVHESIGQHVAVKVLHPSYSARADIVNRFFNEARAVHIVRHPGLVKTFDFGQLPDGSAYMTMELLEGEPLSSRLKRVGGLPLGDALRIARQVGSALAATHQRGIVHRDLKPDNIFLCPDLESVGGERARILDFGIAKVRSEAGAGAAHATATGELMGTPKYMSPEQCRGAGGVDDRTDVYALGVILYQMLAGRPPFTSQAPGELMVLHLTQEPPPLQDLVPALPPGVTALVHGMLRKQPGERPGMAQVVTELERLGAERAHTAPEVSQGALGVGVSHSREAVTQAPSTLGSANGTRQPRPLQRVGVLGSAFLAFVGVGAAAWMLRPGRGLQTDQPAVSSSVAAAPQGWVNCSVTSRPAGARVLRLANHMFLGETPWSIRQGRGDGSLRLVVQLAGHAEQQVTLDPAGECQKEVQLVALPPVDARTPSRKPPSTPHRPHPRHPSPTTDDKPGMDYVPNPMH